MKIIEKIAHWVLAVFMAVIAYVVTMTLGALLLVKAMGLKAGVQPPADFHPQIGTGSMFLMAEIMLFVPLAAAVFVGAMTAPFSQRGIAAVVFPVLVYALFTVMTATGSHAHGWDIATELETALSCAASGVLVYVLCRRQRLRRELRK